MRGILWKEGRPEAAVQLEKGFEVRITLIEQCMKPFWHSSTDKFQWMHGKKETMITDFFEDPEKHPFFF